MRVPLAITNSPIGGLRRSTCHTPKRVAPASTSIRASSRVIAAVTMFMPWVVRGKAGGSCVDTQPRGTSDALAGEFFRQRRHLVLGAAHYRIDFQHLLIGSQRQLLLAGRLEYLRHAGQRA